MMQRIKSILGTQLKKLFLLIPAILLTGCKLSPAIPVIGAYYPGWLFCLIAGVVLTLITRQIILRTYNNLSCAGLVYTALFALYSTMFWLVFF
ncbi:hypothetical protein ERIG_03134 [Escherichia fergusonii B253]|nr:hypothetical protein ERIG_03134 [Escherichia fergusonii B253]